MISQAELAATQCVATLSQPYTTSAGLTSLPGNTRCACPKVSWVAQPDRQRSHGDESDMAMDVLQTCARTSPTLCPMLPPLQSTTVEQLPAMRSANNPPFLWTCQDQAASPQTPSSIPSLVASNSAAGQQAAMLTESSMTTDINTITNFPPGAHTDTSALVAAGGNEATAYVPLKITHDFKETSASRCRHATTSPSGHSSYDRQQASPKSAGAPARVPHKLVERRYRDKMKTQLDTLASKIPAIQASYPCALEVEEVPRSLRGPPKAVIIAGAVKRIEQLEKEVEETKVFVESLQEQITGLQGLVKCDDCSLLRYFENTKTQSTAKVNHS